MKVTVDHDDCEAQGKCMRICPEVFKLDDEDRLHILMDDVPEEYREKVTSAVALCPKQALRLEDLA